MNEIIDDLCDEFEAAIAAGQQPTIERFLDRVEDSLRLPLLRELVLLEHELLDADSVDYQRRFPEAAEDIRDLFDQSNSDATEAPTGQNDDSSASAPFKQIGRYKLLQQIGQGGMGAVWMAEQREPVRRRVAIKLIKSGVADEKFIARFEAERQALAMMSHQNIAKVLDAGNTEEGTPYFVMELVQGVPITDYCDTNELTLRERLELFIPVCRAVEHAHQKGILHRDLKPSNVLVTTFDGEAVPKVIDFGLAKTLQPEIRLTEKTMFTEYGQIVGTVQYMSPEQARLDGMDIDTRTDIYSLGVMLYELLSGSTPIDRDTLRSMQLLEVLAIIREHEPPRPSHRLSLSGEQKLSISQKRKTQPDKLSRTLRGELDWIVMKAIDADRNRRYENATRFAADVRCYLDGEPISAHPPSTAYKIRKFVRRHRASVATVTALLLTLFAATFISMRFGIVANRNSREARSAEARALTAKLKAEEAEKAALASKARSDYFVTGARWTGNRVRDAIAGLERIPHQYRNFEWNLDRRLYEGCDGHFHGHKSRIRSIEFWHEHDIVVTASSDGTVRTWDPTYQRQLSSFSHEHPVYAATASPRGQLFASIDAQRRVVIWDRDSRERVSEFDYYFAGSNRKLSNSDLCCLDFSWDGNLLAIAAADNDVKVWDVQGENLWTIGSHNAKVNSVAFDAQSNRLASASADQTVMVWNQKNGGGQPLTLVAHEGEVFDVDFSPDGKRIASSGEDGTVRIWDALTGTLIKTLRGHSETVLSIEFSPDGLRLASGGSDETIVIWDVHRGEEIFRLRANNWVRGVAFSADGSRLASSIARNGQLWDISSGNNMRTLDGHGAAITAVEFSSDGEQIVASSKDKRLSVWNVPTGQRVALVKHDDQVNDVAMDHQAQRVLTGTKGGRVRIWDFKAQPPRSIEPNSDFFGPGSEVLSIALSGDGTTIAKGLQDGTARLFNQESESLITLRHGEAVRSVAFSPDDALIATASTPSDSTIGGDIKLWDRETGNLKRTLGSNGQGHSKGINQIRFSPDGQMLASASKDDTVRVWDVATGRELCRPIQATKGPDFYDVDFTPDGSRMVATCGDGTIHFWDVTRVRNGIFEEVRSLPGHFDGTPSLDSAGQIGPKNQSTRAVAFSPNGKLLATGSDFGTIRVWNGAPYKATVLLLGHFEAVKAYNFDATNKFILTGASDKTVRLWNVADGELLQTYLGHTRSVRKVAFSADGQTIYSRDEDGIEFAWDRDSGRRVEINDPTRWDPVPRNEATLPTVVLDDRRVILIDRSVLQEEERIAYCETKSQIQVAWHRRLAELAESRNNWFAATFHRAWPVLAESQANDLKKLRRAYRTAKRLAASRDSEENASLPTTLNFPSKVQGALNRLDAE